MLTVISQRHAGEGIASAAQECLGQTAPSCWYSDQTASGKSQHVVATHTKPGVPWGRTHAAYAAADRRRDSSSRIPPAGPVCPAPAHSARSFPTVAGPNLPDGCKRPSQDDNDAVQARSLPPPCLPIHLTSLSRPIAGISPAFCLSPFPPVASPKAMTLFPHGLYDFSRRRLTAR